MSKRRKSWRRCGLDRVDAQVQLGGDLLVARRRMRAALGQAGTAERVEHPALPGRERRRLREPRLGRGRPARAGRRGRAEDDRRVAHPDHVAVAQPPPAVHALLVDEGAVAREPVVLDVPRRPTRASWAWVRETRSSHSIGTSLSGLRPMTAAARSSARGTMRCAPASSRKTRKGSPAASASRMRRRSLGSVGHEPFLRHRPHLRCALADPRGTIAKSPEAGISSVPIVRRRAGIYREERSGEPKDRTRIGGVGASTILSRGAGGDADRHRGRGRPGTVVAGYVIETLAGAGGMGVVYRAHDTELGRTVAIKLIAPRARRRPALARAVRARVAHRRRA